MKNHPLNTYWVVEGRLLAGEYPGDWNGGKDITKIKALIETGINHFIDLTQLWELDPYEHLLKTFGDVGYTRFPIQDASVPTSKGEMTDILNAIDQALDRGCNVYLHCWGGIGRTGTTVGCYYARHGNPGRQALEQLQKAWQGCHKSSCHQSPETTEQCAYIMNWQD